MHTPRLAAAASRELCRVADRLVIVDYPSATQRRGSSSRSARRLCTCRRRARPSRIASSPTGTIARALASSGFRIRSVHRQFVLPIAFHKAIGSRRFTMAVEGLLDRLGLLRLLRIAGHARRRTVRVLVTGATGFTGGHLARTLAARGYAGARARARDASGARPRGGRASSSRSAICAIRPRWRRRSPASRSSITSPRSTGRRACRRDVYRAVNATAVGQIVEAAAAAGVAPRRALQHRRRARRRRASAGQRRRAAQAGRRLPGHEARRRAPGARGRRSVWASRSRSRGRAASTGPAIGGCSSCSAASRGAGFDAGQRRDLLPSDLHRRSRRRLPAVRRASGGREPHLHPRGRRGDDAERAGGADRRGGGRAAADGFICRSGRSGWPAPLCEAVCVPFGIEPPIYRRRVDFFTKSRAFDITRARAEIGYAPRVGLREGIARTLEWYREHGWL